MRTPCDAGEGFVCFDPPYAAQRHEQLYQLQPLRFDDFDHRRLADTVFELTTRGCRVMLSNSSAPLVHELYAHNGYAIHPIEARRNINSRADGRGPVTELLILNYDG